MRGSKERGKGEDKERQSGIGGGEREEEARMDKEKWSDVETGRSLQ